MKNKEIEELLNKIRNSIKTHKKLNLDDDMLVVLEFDVIQWNLLLSYIEQLEKQAELGEHYKHLYNELKKQKDDVLREINFYETTEWGLRGYEILEKFRRMLGEIDD